jgi:hypothetical protein
MLLKQDNKVVRIEAVALGRGGGRELVTLVTPFFSFFSKLKHIFDPLTFR